MMNTQAELDLSDIQGNVVRGYARYGFPKARYVFYRVVDGAAGRAFLRKLVPLVTSAAMRSLIGSAKQRPEVTTDVAISYAGLRALGLPELSLRGFPEEFAVGMRKRCAVLGDNGPSAPEHWDPIWRRDAPVHVLVFINGASVAAIERRYEQISGFAAASDGKVQLLTGHRGDDGQEDLPYQEGSALYEDGEPSPKEHFGFVDGISNPFFKGCGAHPSAVVGNGKLVRRGFGAELSWAPLETGEFLLGHRDESNQLPAGPQPPILATNGTFMAYRKLHENVRAFQTYIEQAGAHFPGGKEALAAKFAGRWRNGAPIAKFPTQGQADAIAEQWVQAKLDIEHSTTPEARRAAKGRFAELNLQMVDFHYNDDVAGTHCPAGAHVRRANPRAALEFGQTLAFETPSALSNRRRIIRRGLPYGAASNGSSKSGNHGIIFMAINASLSRQFEFVQQQWINYGNDFKLANEKDPLLGNHGVASDGTPDGKMIIPAGANRDDAPHFCSRIPRFVETRGGEYFFVPSLTALLMIAEGTVDPT
jgi:Dyp-type peroxidase family